ncbi:MAG: YceK/YidQ family lipoprotein [Granulosicoccus sp.]
MHALNRISWSGTARLPCNQFANYSAKALLLLSLFSSLGGCATTSTLGQPVHVGKPLVLSGVRLNLASLKNETAVSQRYGVSPPTYPLLDLPFSAALDILVLGYTLPAALIYRH